MISHKTLLYANTLLFVGLAGGLKAAPIGFTPTEQTAQLNATSGDMAFVIKKARKVNAHTVELTDAQNRKITVDFYGNNIFRIYQDPAGSAPHNPEAKPAADILVEQPRKQVARLELQQNDQNCTLTTDEIKVVFDNKNSGFAVYKKNEIDPVISSPSFRTFDNDGTHLELTCSPGEYFYGGGVQNGRFSHRGQRIAIENTNNWVDGGVASPTPFYWSTKGYGMLWHTFKPGLYDFGATDAKKVKLRHGEKYLDVFFWVGDRPEALLDGFYQLTGNPVLLPKFGFYEGHLNAYNRDYWTEAKDGKGFMKMEDGKTYNESQKNNGGIRESLNGELENYQFSARAAIDRYLNNDMPLGWFLPNDGYGAGYGQTTTLDGNIKNLKSFGDYARSKGVEIGLWTQSDLHPKDSIEALLQRDIVKEVRDAGVRVLKTDVAWVGWGYSFGLNGVADVGKIMPKYGNNARPFIISLDGWAARNATPASGAATKRAVTGSTFASTSPLSSAPAFRDNPTSLPTSTVFSVGRTFPSMCVSSNGRPSPRWSSTWTDGARTPNIRRPSVAKARRSTAGISN